MNDTFDDSPLGRKVAAVLHYDPTLLYPIERLRLRQELLADPDRLPFDGCDLWTAWELSWLDRRGKPEVAVARIRVPCRSPAIIESKSLKLYLNSFSQTPFAAVHDVVQTLRADLSKTAGVAVEVDLPSLVQVQRQGLSVPEGECLDALPVEVDRYQRDPDLLVVAGEGRIVTESLHSNLLHSLCPVTGQPDIGSIQIGYTGERIDHASLLRYIVSYREHQDFHEQCVERIFLDIMERCSPRELSVCAYYNRRGGIDINPFRSTSRSLPPRLRLARQ